MKDQPMDVAKVAAGLTKAQRDALAELYCASGCSCCRDDDKWYAVSDALAVLLDAPRCEDDSGVDWRSIRDAARAALNGGNDG